MNRPCYLIRKNGNIAQDNTSLKLIAQTENNIAQNLYMPTNGSFIWVTEQKAKELFDESDSYFKSIKQLNKLFVMKRSRSKAYGPILGYIPIDEYNQLNKNALNISEKKYILCLLDLYSAVEFEKSNKSCNLSYEDIETYINKLPRVPTKRHKLDISSFNEDELDV